MNKEKLIEEVTRRVINQLKEERGILTEMEFSHSDYVDRVDFNTAKIIQNWCLIDYVNRFGEYQEQKEHWQTELMTHLNRIYQSKIVNGDKKQKKLALVSRLWFERGYEINTDITFVTSIIRPRFKQEGIIDEDRIEIVAQDLMSNIKEIAEIMTCNSPLSTDEYVRQL